MPNRGNPESVKALPDLSRFRNRVSTSLLSMVRAMNGAFTKLVRIAKLPQWATSQQLLVRAGAPAMAVLGVSAIVAVLLGLQCGGLDKCFAGRAPVTAASVSPAALPPAAEASLNPEAAVPAQVSAEVVSAAPPVTEVAMTKAPVVPEGVQRAQRVDAMIGDTFVALASDDEGWLAGAAASASADPETYAEGDGAGPPVPADDETAAEAASAIATGETPVQPLERPTPLDVAAFAEQSGETAENVKAEAQRKLAEVTRSEPEPEVKPEPKPEAEANAEPEPEPKAEPKAEPMTEPEPAEAEAAAEGDTRTIAGAGVNVRSGPGKSNGKLFGLAGGVKVTVGENQRGWLKITDDQGRTGWVYKDYLN